MTYQPSYNLLIITNPASKQDFHGAKSTHDRLGTKDHFSTDLALGGFVCAAILGFVCWFFKKREKLMIQQQILDALEIRPDSLPFHVLSEIWQLYIGPSDLVKAWASRFKRVGNQEKLMSRPRVTDTLLPVLAQTEFAAYTSSPPQPPNAHDPSSHLLLDQPL
ncbi:hypothetical protein HBI51_209720 [Parastagonospora nodorum]|nr:hypothetical protein HBI74_216950 [Parastagonospora nodorum]KAH5628785.1 hypothetical protein HBI51_209720 [Parastagonospora nodorum]KAH6200312.1 hypothetical protein HBI15_194250 [Parastagonospora nodorum]